MLSQICEMGFENHFGLGVAELLSKQVAQLNQNAIILMAIIFVMWILQPVFNKYVEKNYPDDDERLQIVYKWLGIGMLFIAGLIMVYVGWVI